MKRLAWMAATAAAATFVLSGCTGLSLGENGAGDDTYLEDVPIVSPGEIGHATGSIAVDHRRETTFVLKTTADWTNVWRDEPKIEKELFAIFPDTADVLSMGDYSDAKDLRILFPESGVLVMSETDGQDRLELFGERTLAPKKTVERDVRYHGTRMSPSRDFIAVADNTSAKNPIHILDGETLESAIIPHNGDWLEAMWMNQRDELVAIVFYGFPNGAAPYARILSWDMNELSTCGLHDVVCWDASRLDVTVPGVTGDLWFSFTWVGVSPDDRLAVFPVRTLLDEDTHRNDLLVVDLDTGAVETVEDAKGPVGFTPDGQTIVSYTNDSDGNQDLLLIDALTLEKDLQTVDIQGGVSFFVSHEGNFIVVASNFGDQKLVLYDLDQEKQTQMDGPSAGLTEFVSRLGHGELWLIDGIELLRLDLNAGELEVVPLDFWPRHINILPNRDVFAMDDDSGEAIRLFSPWSRSVTHELTLP